jgi:CRP-like cAMP-binding protein
LNSKASHFDIFQWLSEDTADALRKAGHMRRVPTGGIIYVQAEPGDEMYRLVSGSVRLYVSNADGRQLTFLLFGSGDCFGNASVIDGGPRPQTAEAHEACELQVFDKASLDTLRARYPELSDALLHLTSRQSRILSNFFAQSYLDQPAARVAQRLAAEIDRYGLKPKMGERVSAKLSQSELALMVGATRQTVNKVLRQFKIQGLIAVDRGELIVLDLSALRAIGEEMTGIPSRSGTGDVHDMSRIS